MDLDRTAVVAEMSKELSERGYPWALLLFSRPVEEGPSDVPDLSEEAGDKDLSQRLFGDLKRDVLTLLDDRRTDPSLEWGLLRAELTPRIKQLFDEVNDRCMPSVAQFQRDGITYGVAFVAGAWIDDVGGYHHFVALAGSGHNIKVVLKALSVGDEFTE